MQKEYFYILAEVFKRATGKGADKFSTPEDFGLAIKKDASKIGKRLIDAYNWGAEQLIPFYEKYKGTAFQEGRNIGGLKFVLGGGSRFTKSHIPALKKMLLYSDTIFIPDPVLPWIESERREEKFRLTLLLENIFMILQLKPVVDADLAYPAVFVFPSFEKSLEREDSFTKDQLNNLLTSFLGYYTRNSFISIDETLEYVNTKEAEFLQAVHTQHLFIPVGENLLLDLKTALQEYKEYIQTWRAEEYIEKLKGFSDGQLVWLGIFEKLAPQFHLLENSSEFHAHPMSVFDSQWHYFVLCAEMTQGQLEQLELLQAETIKIIRSLQRPNFNWLGNIPIDVIAHLREQNENEEFRAKLSQFTSMLNESELDNLDRVTAEVGRGIASLLHEHKKKIQEIQDRYNRLHTQTAVSSWVTLGAAFVPWLTPLTSLSALGLTGKYANQKYNEYLDKKLLSNSLLGVLAKAKTESKT